MSQDAKSLKVSILHFDDESRRGVDDPHTLYFTYREQRESWIVKGSVKRNKRRPAFELRPTPAHRWRSSIA